VRLQGKTAIVTGAGRGIGLAYAARLLREGANVVVGEVNEKEGATALNELETLGPVEFVKTDVADPASVEACARAAADRFGGIDVLINNAALYGDWDMADQSYEYLLRIFEVNLHGVWLMSRAVAPYMVEMGGGRIINQASGAAYNYRAFIPSDEFPGLGSFNYQQSKWGVVGLTKFMASQLGHWSITVNCIAPGVIDTAATRSVIPRSMIDGLATQQAVPGVLCADDLTGAAVFFASDEARFVTGQVLVIDGGKHMPA
jgi:NAD(P)-dependent dehydrogenase (short-subunit alcohol dehydrogenase family)